jgi:hypothetical protein
MANADPKTTAPPSVADLMDAADMMTFAANGHCSFSEVRPEIADQRKRVAAWLKGLAIIQRRKG